MKREYVYIEQYGAVYRLTRRNWARMLKRLAKEEEVKFSDYGQFVCVVSFHMADFGAEEARDVLLDL